jgi:hypothetical protein
VGEHDEANDQCAGDKREQTPRTDLSIDLGGQSEDAGTYDHIDNDGGKVPSAESPDQFLLRHLGVNLKSLDLEDALCLYS